jgi:DNA topoisomerase-2
LDVPGFLKQFITPIVKATKPRANGQDIVKTFFTVPEFEKWCKTDPSAKNYQIKYYKGKLLIRLARLAFVSTPIPPVN